VAVAVAALEGAVLVLYGLSLLPSLEGERLAMGASTVLFFAVYGGFLVYCAVQLYRLRSWARPPLVLAQLMQIVVGASFWGGSTTAIAVVAVVTAVVTIVGVFHPASIAAIERQEEG
jgi:hypothetical protein